MVTHIWTTLLRRRREETFFIIHSVLKSMHNSGLKTWKWGPNHCKEVSFLQSHEWMKKNIVNVNSLRYFYLLYMHFGKHFAGCGSHIWWNFGVFRVHFHSECVWSVWMRTKRIKASEKRTRYIDEVTFTMEEVHYHPCRKKDGTDSGMPAVPRIPGQDGESTRHWQNATDPSCRFHIKICLGLAFFNARIWAPLHHLSTWRVVDSRAEVFSKHVTANGTENIQTKRDLHQRNSSKKHKFDPREVKTNVKELNKDNQIYSCISTKMWCYLWYYLLKCK